MMRTLSDFAAMSGLPRYALVTLIVPANREARWMTQLYQGLERAARRCDVAIVGGETSAIRGPLVISISALGFVEKARAVLRSGGKAGDILFVTGKLGGSMRKGTSNFVPRIDEARWLTENFRIHAMMDLSDGLGADLPRLARASRVGFTIEESALPRARGCSIRQAISDGEDYELLFALSPNDVDTLQRKWRRKFPRLPLTRIGRLNHHHQHSAIHIAPVASFTSNSVEETIAFARQWSGRLCLTTSSRSSATWGRENAFRQRIAPGIRERGRRHEPDFYAGPRISQRAAAGFSLRFLPAQSPDRNRGDRFRRLPGGRRNCGGGVGGSLSPSLPGANAMAAHRSSRHIGADHY